MDRSLPEAEKSHLTAAYLHIWAPDVPAPTAFLHNGHKRLELDTNEQKVHGDGFESLQM